LNPSSRAAEELSDRISSDDHEGISSEAASEKLLFTMAVEKAKQGENVFNEWFKDQTKDAKAWLREHKAEIVALYPK
jgi:hypothetical protein